MYIEITTIFFFILPFILFYFLEICDGSHRVEKISFTFILYLYYREQVKIEMKLKRQHINEKN